MRIFHLWIIFFITLAPHFVFAQIEITEIMYDPEGTDSSAGSEWIEVHNTGSTEVDLTTWYFFENETHHKITTDGATTVVAGEYALISRDPDAFTEFFGSRGKIFRASFSLNDAESLAMKNNNDKDGIISDSISYSSEQGAKNDGNSLQLVSGSWVPATPTPGKANSGGTDTSDSGSHTTNNTTTSSSSGSVFAPLDTKQISVSAGPNKTVIAGADVLFSADGFGTNGEPLEGGRYMWIFGDGASDEKKVTLHSFAFPGQYRVVVHLSSGKYTASAYVDISAEPSALILTDRIPGPEGYIEVSNGSQETLVLSYWLLRTSEKQFIFPQDTRIRSGASIKFPNTITHLENDTEVELLYPNGTVAYRYHTVQKSIYKNTGQNTIINGDVTPIVAPIQKREEMPESMIEQEVTTNTEEAILGTTTESVVLLSIPASASKAPSASWLLVLGGLLVLSAVTIIVIHDGMSFESDSGAISRMADTITLSEEKE
jgi:hypothetical protein